MRVGFFREFYFIEVLYGIRCLLVFEVFFIRVLFLIIKWNVYNLMFFKSNFMILEVGFLVY